MRCFTPLTYNFLREGSLANSEELDTPSHSQRHYEFGGERRRVSLNVKRADNWLLSTEEIKR